MKKSILYLIAVFMIMTSCNDFYFKSPQPQQGKELKAIPDELIGTYYEKPDASEDGDKGDPLIITRNSYDLKTSDPEASDMKVSGTLAPGKVVLKKLDDYYVLSQKIENPLNNTHDSVWEIYVLKYSDNELILYNLTSEEREPMVDSVKGITKVQEETEGNDKIYLLNPSRKQFKKLVNNDLFNKAGVFEKVK
ncbi:MAG TPA: hypothetical protein VFG54_05400 [Prolixibacteraceae bacterium]|nr:hypothetical protein [Prolixibacteraceae bacterium]